MRGRSAEEADIADAAHADLGEVAPRELGVPPSGAKGSLPTFTGRTATSAEVSESIRLQYAADERKRREQGIEQGFKELKHRSRARKYLAQVMQRKLETHVDNILWEDTHDLEIRDEHIRHLERVYKESGKTLLREAERVVFALEHERVKAAKTEATRLFERNWPLRLKKRLLAGSILVLSVAFLTSISALSRITGNPLRARLATWARLDTSENLAAWLACDDPHGVSLDLTSGGTPTSYCDPDSVIENYYLYNVTNADDIAQNGATPVVREVGPFPFARRHRKVLVRSTNASVVVNRIPYFDYLGDDAALDASIVLPNVGYFRLVAYLVERVGLTDSDAVLFPWLAVLRLHARFLASPEMTAETWFEQQNATDCWTFGCYLFRRKFAALVSAESDAAARADAVSSNLEGMPIFGNVGFSAAQKSKLWSILQEDAEFASTNEDGDPACLFALDAFCDTVGTAVSNAKIIVDAFLELWTYSGTTVILTSLDRVRLASGIESGSLDAFYDGISTRNAECQTATAKVGSLSCTQLNDIAQYLYWLFQIEWATMGSRRAPAKGPFVERSAREFLITGYADVSMALLSGAMRAIPSVLDQPASRADFPAGLFAAEYDASALSESDLAWLAQAWVPGIVQGVTNQTLPDVLAAVNATDNVQVVPGTWILATGAVDGETLALERRAYLTGAMAPGYVQTARFLQAIDGQITARYFGETTTLQGRDQWTQFAPTLDILWTGIRLDTDGFAYSDNAVLQVWQDEVPVWIDDVWRAVTFARRASLDAYNGTSIDALRYALKYDRIRRFALDRSSDYATTCMVNISPRLDYLPIWVGYPSYLTCNSTNGAETPSTRDESNSGFDEGLTYDEIVSQNQGNDQDGEDIDYDIFPEAEMPLPLDERATLQGVSERLATNTTMNSVVIEPVSGATMGYSVDLGMYIQLQAMASMLPDAPTVKLPYYATTQERQMPSQHREALATAITRSARQMRAVSWIGSMTAIACLVPSLLVLFRNRGTPELKTAQVRPVESLESEADEKRKELQRQEREHLKDLKRKHSEALEELRKAHQKLTQEFAAGYETLFKVDTRPQHDVQGRQITRRQDGAKADAIYGIARDGDVFMFTNAEIETLVNKYGNPLEHIAVGLTAPAESASGASVVKSS